MMWKVEAHAETCRSRVRGGTEGAVGNEKMAPTNSYDVGRGTHKSVL